MANEAAADVPAPRRGGAQAPLDRLARAWAIVLAAGGGSRFGAAKQFADLGGEPMLAHPVRTAGAVCDGVVLVLPADAAAPDDPAARPAARNDVTTRNDMMAVNGAAGHAWPAGVRAVAGGASRAESVRAGLAATPADTEIIVVTDAAHPLATTELYRRVVEAVRCGADAAVPGVPLTEVVARVVRTGSGLRTAASLPREDHRLIQTPHAFRAGLLRAVHAGAPEAVEDSAMVADAGGTVVVVPGEPTNIHVTTPAELEMARLLLAGHGIPGGGASMSTIPAATQV